MEFSEQSFSTSSSEIAPKALPSETIVPRIMPRILGTRDMTAMFVVSIYLASCATTAAAVGPAAFTYLLLAAITFFVPCLIATAQLGSLSLQLDTSYDWRLLELLLWLLCLVSLCTDCEQSGRSFCHLYTGIISHRTDRALAARSRHLRYSRHWRIYINLAFSPCSGPH